MKSFVFVNFSLLFLASCGQPQDAEVQALSQDGRKAVEQTKDKVDLYMATGKGCGPCVLIKKELSARGILEVNGEEPIKLTDKYAPYFNFSFCYAYRENAEWKAKSSSNLSVSKCEVATEKVAKIADPTLKEFVMVPYYILYLEKSRTKLSSYATITPDESLSYDEKEKSIAKEFADDIEAIYTIRKEGSKAVQEKIKAAQAKENSLPDAKIPDTKVDNKQSSKEPAQQTTAPKKENTGNNSGLGEGQSGGVLKALLKFFQTFFPTSNK